MSEPGFSRTLPKGGVLWWEGDPASSLAVVETGCLGVRAGGTLIDIAIGGTVLGESALLAAPGAPGRRTAQVTALEASTVVVEHPVAALREQFDPAVGAIVLRTLLYQVARNVLLVRAAEGERPVLRELLDGLLGTAAAAHARAATARTGEDFRAAFRLAYRLRESSDLARAELAPPERWTPEKVRAELSALQARGFASELLSAVDGFLALWSSRPA